MTSGDLRTRAGAEGRGAALELERSVRKARRRLGADARALLLGSPREVLARIAAHDPLDLRALVGRRLAARYLLMDAERAQLAGLARIARRARRYRPSVALEAWLEREVDAAIDELLAEEARAVPELDARAPDGADEVREPGAWSDLARPLGLAPRGMRAACARFNALPDEVREAFVRLVLERRSPDRYAAETRSTLTEVARRARRAVDAVLGAADVEEPRRAFCGEAGNPAGARAVRRAAGAALEEHEAPRDAPTDDP